MGRDIAVDLGTANTLVYVRGQGIALILSCAYRQAVEAALARLFGERDARSAVCASCRIASLALNALAEKHGYRLVKNSGGWRSLDERRPGPTELVKDLFAHGPPPDETGDVDEDPALGLSVHKALSGPVHGAISPWLESSGLWARIPPVHE